MKTEKKKSILEDEEIIKILQDAEDQMPDQINEFHTINKQDVLSHIPADTQDPDLAHKLYYGFIQKLLREYLPKGAEYKKAIKYIRAETNLYLKEGKKSGRDGRQAYTHIMRKASNTIIDWYNGTKGKDLAKLYNLFKNLNDEREKLNSKD